MNYKYFVTFLFFAIVGIYLFATAPQILVTENSSERKIHIKAVLNIINREHEVVRSVYTKMIVKPGKRNGLKFDEHWKEKDIHAGPLPALFLRLTAVGLEKSKVPLGLYLGSDFPISAENKLTGIQQNEFIQLKSLRTSRFFYVNDIQRFTLMEPDIAVSDICVDCHNKHKDSTKQNWKINDVMGAVTWTYPDEYVTYETAIGMLAAFRASVLNAYLQYIDKARHFERPPTISDHWPSEGYFLPSPDTFMREIGVRASPLSINALYQLSIAGK